jgi:two-component system, cell cycle sensor histidine kinase and response regulator CckA
LGVMRGDPHQIGQVIINLAVNARDAMPRGGSLTLETDNVFLDHNYALQHLEVWPGAYVMLAVSDNGCGMAKEIQSRIFEPFFTTKAKGEGTGLGLSMVYGIVKQNGGNISVYSELGQGSVFKIYFPQVHANAVAFQDEEETKSVPRGTETILLVEDESSVLELVQNVLAELGYNVLSADSADEAIRLFDAHQESIDLLLTDVVMPHLGGSELAGRLASLCPSLKVLYMSGYTDDAIVHHGVLDPGVAFIQKPFLPAALGRKVRQVLDA